MKVTDTAIPGVRVLVPQRFGDERGFFSEVYNRDRFLEHGLPVDWVQDNHAFSRDRGTVRGLHYQLPPFAQTKLVRVTRGAIHDVVVDIRRGSPTFGRHVAVTVSAAEWNQLLVPVGFAHGYCTLEPDTEVLYKVSAIYSPEHERGIRWDDPALGIEWPVSTAEAIVSEKDRGLPGFDFDFDFDFEFEGRGR
jgi:dTDP-4-dehydrorhamnose 3,5-epimerase